MFFGSKIGQTKHKKLRTKDFLSSLWENEAYLIILAFKTANVIPIFKKGNQRDWNKYKPISLQSNIGRIIEKLIHKRQIFKQ